MAELSIALIIISVLSLLVIFMEREKYIERSSVCPKCSNVSIEIETKKFLENRKVLVCNFCKSELYVLEINK